MPAPEEDYYQRLRIPRTANRAQIKAAFRRLARQYHPDLNPHDPEAQARFRALREAYEVLIDSVQRQRYDQGVTDWEPEVSAPRTAQDFYLRGIHHVLARRYREALSDFDQALAQSQFLEAYLRRAQVRYLLSDDAGVLADCQRALQIEPQNVQAIYYQGLARYRLGYTQGAIAAFSTAAELDPDDPQIYYYRGVAHDDLQEREAAIADFRTAASAFEAQGDRAGVERAQARLQELGVVPRRRSLPRLRLFTLVRLLVALLLNPVESLLRTETQLSARQATELGCLLGLIAASGFTLSGRLLRTAEAAPAAILTLWLTASAAFLGLAAALAFTRVWFRSRSRWSTDVLIAGVALLPLGVYALLGPASLLAQPLFGLLTLLAFGHSLFVLYAGCSQIHGLSERVAVWIAPSLLFLSFCAGYVAWSVTVQ